MFRGTRNWKTIKKKTGEEMAVWSINGDRTLVVFPAEEIPYFDAEFMNSREVKYDDLDLSSYTGEPADLEFTL